MAIIPIGGLSGWGLAGAWIDWLEDAHKDADDFWQIAKN
jgi:hypothetical protein